MEYSYELFEDGYIIYRNGVAYLDQRGYVLYPRPTMEESAQAHIDEIITNNEQANQDVVTMEQLKTQVAEMQDALIELAELVGGGA